MSNNHILQGKDLTFTVGNKCLINSIDISVPQGSFTAIIGPNGAGKTTLLNLLNGDLPPNAGEVLLNKQSLANISRLDLAKQRAVLPQLSSIPFSITARDIVALGREPYRYDNAHQYDKAVIDNSLNMMAVTTFASNNYTTLSGGEQSRIQIARTLAQICTTPNITMALHSKILFLDEPTNHLDIHHQYRLMHTLKNLQQNGLTIVAVMHDLSLTLQFAEQIILLQQGQRIGDYTPDELVAADALSTVYQMQMNIRWDENSQRYLLIPQLLYNNE